MSKHLAFTFFFVCEFFNTLLRYFDFCTNVLNECDVVDSDSRPVSMEMKAVIVS